MIYVDNRYTIILADPPWEYVDKLQGDNMRGGAEDTLDGKVLSMEEMTSIPVGDLLAADDAALFLWVTGPHMASGLHVELSRAWGFEPVTDVFVWRTLARSKARTLADVPRCSHCQNVLRKPFYGTGRWTRSSGYEYVILAVRGKPWRFRVSKGVPQEILWPWLPDHGKPPIVRDRIEELMGTPPRLELFARDRGPGWDATGLELDGFDIRYLRELT